MSREYRKVRKHVVAVSLKVILEKTEKTASEARQAAVREVEAVLRQEGLYEFEIEGTEIVDEMGVD